MLTQTFCSSSLSRAGPVGLLSVLAAVRRGCKNILVLEQAHELKKVGQALVLQENGMCVVGLVAPKVFEYLFSSHNVNVQPVKVLNASWTPFARPKYAGFT